MRVYIGLGSNLDHPRGQLACAIAEIRALAGVTVKQVSSFYDTPPFGRVPQPDFVNAVMAIETCLSPETLLNHLQNIERVHGRVRRERWGPRTLDLDILWFGNLRCDRPNLTIPHPGIPDREFVLRPLREIQTSLTLFGISG